MVARKFVVHHNDVTFDVDYDTDDGLELFKVQLFSLTAIPPDEQKIVGGDEDRVISDDSHLISICDKLRLVSISDDESSCENARFNEELVKSDEEFARMLQAEEEALLYQQYVAGEDNGEMEQRLRSYINQVLMYEDPNRQNAARKTVPIDELEEKASVAIAKEGNFEPSDNERDHAFLLQLLFWFKQSFRYCGVFVWGLQRNLSELVTCSSYLLPSLHLQPGTDWRMVTGIEEVINGFPSCGDSPSL